MSCIVYFIKNKQNDKLSLVKGLYDNNLIDEDVIGSYEQVEFLTTMTLEQQVELRILTLQKELVSEFASDEIKNEIIKELNLSNEEIKTKICNELEKLNDFSINVINELKSWKWFTKKRNKKKFKN